MRREKRSDRDKCEHENREVCQCRRCLDKRNEQLAKSEESGSEYANVNEPKQNNEGILALRKECKKTIRKTHQI